MKGEDRHENCKIGNMVIDVVTVYVLPTLEGRGESRWAFLVCIECMRVNKGQNKRHCNVVAEMLSIARSKLYLYNISTMHEGPCPVQNWLLQSTVLCESLNITTDF